MKKLLMISLLIGLLLLNSSCISATLSDCLPKAKDTYPLHTIDAILFSKPDSITETWALLSNGSELSHESPAVHFYTNQWSKTSFFNLEPIKKTTDEEPAVYLTAKQIKLWHQEFMVTNKEPYLDFYSYDGDFVKRFLLPIPNVDNFEIQNCFIFGEDLIVVGIDKVSDWNRILVVSSILGIKKDWSLTSYFSQVTTDGHNIFALSDQGDSTTLLKLDLMKEKLSTEKTLPGIWREIVYQSPIIYGNIKTENGSALVETDSTFDIKKTHWSTQFENIHILSQAGSSLSIFVEDTNGFYFWEETKGLTLAREMFSSSEANAYFPLCVKKDPANNLLLLDEDQKISIINIEMCNPNKLLVYDSYCISNYVLASTKAWAKTETRLLFADKNNALYEMTMEKRAPIKAYQFEKTVEQVEVIDESVLILLEDSTLWRYENKKMVQIELPKITILSMTIEENIPYFLISQEEKEEIMWLDPNINQLIPLNLRVSADTTDITLFAVCKNYYSIANPYVFTIESTVDGDYLCIYGEDGKRLFSSAMSLINVVKPIPVQQIFYYRSDKFLMVSKEQSTVFTFKGIQVE
jgi:hypothetical protein